MRLLTWTVSDSEVGILVVLAIYLFVVVFPLWRIFRRMGFMGWISLLLFIPLVNLVVVWVVAFADWPAARRKRAS